MGVMLSFMLFQLYIKLIDLLRPIQPTQKIMRDLAYLTHYALITAIQGRALTPAYRAVHDDSLYVVVIDGDVYILNGIFMKAWGGG